MPAEQYAFGGPPAAPHTAAATRPPPPPQTAAAPAAASAARSYGALLSTHQHGRPAAHPHYMAATGPVPPLPQRFAARPATRPRRLSNAPSDPSDGMRAGPVRAGPTNAHGSSSDGGGTSEDEIESLKRAMGSDQWALQRQRMRRDRLARHQLAPSDGPSSPATQDTALSTPVPAAYDAHTSAPADAISGSAYAYPAATLAQQLQTTQPYVQASYPLHRPHPHALPQHLPASGAYAVPVTNPFAYGTMAPAATHALTALAHAPVAAREYIVPGYPMDSAQLLPPGGYVPASGAPPDSASRHESASVRSNDQMSGTVTDASGYSQAYWAQGAPHFQPPRTYEVGVPAAAAVPGSTYPHQSPTTAHAQPPMRAAPDSPIAASASPVPAPMPEMREQRRYSPAVSAAAAGPSHALAAAGSGVPPVPTGSSAFAIHSLLNPPIEPPALAPHYPGGGGDVPGSPSSSTAAVLQHL
ncbi:hypothetical protein IWQ56_003924, partial [Coemansia nantahalensis]